MTRLVLGAYNRIGVETLRRAAADPGIEDLAVFTHDSRAGVPDVLAVADELGVWATTHSMDEVAPPFEPDVISLVYYRHIVSGAVIDSVGGRIFNVHPSLLPRHRGCSSVPWAIIEGDQVTGVTCHYVEPTVDSGRILVQGVLDIRPDETQASLYERCMDLGAALWPAALTLVRSRFEGVPQNGPSCWHPRGVPHAGEIDPSWPLEYIERFIRAMTLPPQPYATYEGVEVRTLEGYKAIRDGVLRARSNRE